MEFGIRVGTTELVLKVLRPAALPLHLRMYTELSRRLYNSNLKLSKLVLNEPCDLLAEYKIFKTIKSLQCT